MPVQVMVGSFSSVADQRPWMVCALGEKTLLSTSSETAFIGSQIAGNAFKVPVTWAPGPCGRSVQGAKLLALVRIALPPLRYSTHQVV